jgi:hypothetical protein
LPVPDSPPGRPGNAKLPPRERQSPDWRIKSQSGDWRSRQQPPTVRSSRIKAIILWSFGLSITKNTAILAHAGACHLPESRPWAVSFIRQLLCCSSRQVVFFGDHFLA